MNNNKLDTKINVNVETLVDIQFEIKKIKFQIANLREIFPLSREELKAHSIFLFKTKRMLKEKRDKLKKEIQ